MQIVRVRAIGLMHTVFSSCTSPVQIYSIIENPNSFNTVYNPNNKHKIK